MTPLEHFLFWGGDERGGDFGGPRQDFPNCVPVGSHAPHAVGVALAFKLRREPRVAVCIFGDGATSKGDVYEAINIAGAWRLPVVFVISNNQWATSVPRGAQSAAETLAQKAIATGILGEQVDGSASWRFTAWSPRPWSTPAPAAVPMSWRRSPIGSATI